jgi:hypothetical protein
MGGSSDEGLKPASFSAAALSDRQGEVLAAHLPTRLGHRGQQRGHLKLLRVKLNGKEVPVRIILHLVDACQGFQGGAHGVGTAASDKTAPLHHAVHFEGHDLHAALVLPVQARCTYGAVRHAWGEIPPSFTKGLRIPAAPSSEPSGPAEPGPSAPAGRVPGPAPGVRPGSPASSRR